MIPFLHAVVVILLLAFIFYIKLLPYKARLYPKYSKLFSFFDKLFAPVLSGLRRIFKPVLVGQNLSMDMSQLVVFIILLLLLQIF